MNFYFCEGCGKRVTEKEIDQGQGKNKKLKGVYCLSCSVGVTTMEALPLDDEEAKKLLANEVSKTGPKSKSKSKSMHTARPALKRAGVRGSSSHRIPLPRPEKGASRQGADQSGRRIETQRGGSSVVIGLAVGAVALIGLVVFIASSGAPAKSKRSSLTSKDNDRGKAESNSNLTSDAGRQQNPLVGSNSRLPSTSSAQSNAKKMWSEFERQVAQSAPDDFDSRIALVEAFLAKHSASTFANEARSRLDAWRKKQAEAKPSPTESASLSTEVKKNELLKETKGPIDKTTEHSSSKDPKPEGDPLVATPKVVLPPPVPEFQKRFHLLLKELLAALKTDDLDQALTIASKASKDETLKKWQVAGQALPPVMAVFETERKQREKKLSSLVGRTLTLQTRKGRRKGKVIAVHAGTLEMQQTYIINGKTKTGAKFKLALADLTSTQLKRLFPKKEPSGDQQWMARALSHLSTDDALAAEKALDHCPRHPATEAVKNFLELAREEILEKKAVVQWEQWLAETEKKVTEKKARELLEQLDVFEKEHGHRAFVQLASKQKASARKRLAEASLFSTRALAALFKGQLKDYDPRTRKATVYYDFKNANQLEDFNVNAGTQTATIQVAGGLLRMVRGAPDAIVSQRFDPENLKIQFVLKAGTANVPADMFAVGMGSRNACLLRIQNKKLGLIHNLIKYPNRSLADSLTRVKAFESVDINRPSQTTFILHKEGNRVRVSMNGQQVMEASLPSEPQGNVLSFGQAGGDLECAIGHLTITGSLSSGWVESALAVQQAVANLSGPQNIWNAKAGGRWNEAANWSLGHVPAPGDNVIFDLNGGNCNVPQGSVASGLKSFLVADSFTGTITFAPKFGEGDTQELSLSEDFLIMNGTVIVSGFVEGEGKTAKGTGVTIKARHFVLGAAAHLHSDKNGFPVNMGPGTNSGGAHGGRGGIQRYSASVTRPYGDSRAPVTLGSGGAFHSGGGAIKIDVASGKAVVNGVISVNGGSAARCGAGGSVYILCSVFSGSGSLEAKGGQVSKNASKSTGGAGGRIAVHFKTSTFSGSYDLRNGIGGQGMGRPGTIFLSDFGVFEVRQRIALAPGEYKMKGVIVHKGGLLEMQSDPESGKGCVITAERFEIEAGGTVSANGLGFALKSGPGAFKITRGGATHAGKGGKSDTEPYGNPKAPITSGSGSGRQWGGGAIKLELGQGLLRVDGTLSANGENGSYTSGGAAGGSVFVQCGSFEGSGKVEAKGGPYLTANKRGTHGGGGGRIAIDCKKKIFTGEVSAAGGKAANGADGGDGSVAVGR